MVDALFLCKNITIDRGEYYMLFNFSPFISGQDSKGLSTDDFAIIEEIKRLEAINTNLAEYERRIINATLSES